MQRKPVFLALALAEAARYLSLAFAADGLGLLREGAASAALLRFASAPQLLFPAAFFFLWLDGARHAAYRPLLAAGKVVSLASLLPLGLALARSLGEPGPVARPVEALAIAGCAGLVDLAGLLALAFAARFPVPAPGPALPGAARGDTTAPGPTAGNAPRGPEDIEDVEA